MIVYTHITFAILNSLCKLYKQYVCLPSYHDSCRTRGAAIARLEGAMAPLKF